MKKILSLILCLMLVCTAAASFADETLAPSVKIQRQMQNDGNGIKGSFRIDGNASMEENPLFAALQGAEYDLLRTASGEDWHLVVFQQDEQGQQINKTELYSEATGLYFRSDFLPDRVFRVPGAENMIPDSFRGAGENPSILTVLASVASKSGAEKARWDSVAQKYTSILETWLAGYAQTPELQRGADGTTKMKLIYIVPAEEIRGEIVSLVKTAAQDPEAMALLAPEMTEEQRVIYLSAGLEEYYSEALKSIRLTGEIRFEKEVTTLGEMTGAGITLPLDPGMTGYHTLELSSRNGKTGLTLTGDNGMIRLVIPEGLDEIMGQAPFEGTGSLLCYSAAEDRKDSNLSLSFSIRKAFETYSDEETGRIHEIHHFTVNVSRDTQNLPDGMTDADFPAFETIDAEANFHFSSKAPQSSPVTVESSISITRGETNLTLAGKVKTAATWPFVPFAVENAKAMAEMNQEETAAAFAEWIRNAAEKITRTE